MVVAGRSSDDLIGTTELDLEDRHTPAAHHPLATPSLRHRTLHLAAH